MGLKSKFQKSKTVLKASEIFTDRDEPRAAFSRFISSVSEEQGRILVFHGIGGIGKTRLLKELYKNAETEYSKVPSIRFHSIRVNLDTYDFANPVNVLTSIRNEVHGECGLFDYAVLEYFAKAKLNINDIKEKNRLSGPVWDVFNEILQLGTGSVGIPLNILRKFASALKERKTMKMFHNEIEEIQKEDLTEADLFELLPHYLGLCIRAAAESGDYHVLFLDSYESIHKRTGYNASSEDQAEWLRELFLSSESIRMVIGSRDKLRWNLKDPEWDDVMEQHLLNSLSENDSLWFLDHFIDDDSAKNLILKNAAGHPLYLDMCVNLYAANQKEGKAFELSGHTTGEQIIDRYLNHLSPHERTATSVLSILHVFDIAFAQKLLQQCDLPFDSKSLEDLLKKSLFVYVDERKHLYKVDETVRHHQLSHIPKEDELHYLQAILHCILQIRSGSAFPYLAIVSERACAPGFQPDELYDALMEATDYYSNIGFFDELHRIWEPMMQSENMKIRSIAIYQDAVRLKRIGHLSAALELINQNPFDQDVMGHWYYLYRFLQIHLYHLQGMYDKSLSDYEGLLAQMGHIRKQIPDHVYLMPAMKYADILFLKGRFDESLKQIRDLEQLHIDIQDQIELLRIKGHICRFQKQYDNAVLIYNQALTMSEKHDIPSERGKLYTNLAETYCFTQPDTALDWFRKAEDIHHATDNKIELGKAHAAASIAYTMLSDYDEAILHAKRSVDLAGFTAYQSGQAFGYAAMYAAYHAAGEDRLAAESAEKLREIVDRIGVYQFLTEGVS